MLSVCSVCLIVNYWLVIITYSSIFLLYNANVKSFTYGIKFSEYNTMLQYKLQLFCYITSFIIPHTIQYGLQPFCYYFLYSTSTVPQTSIQWYNYNTVHYFLQFHYTLAIYTIQQLVWFSFFYFHLFALLILLTPHPT